MDTVNKFRTFIYKFYILLYPLITFAFLHRTYVYLLTGESLLNLEYLDSLIVYIVITLGLLGAVLKRMKRLGRRTQTAIKLATYILLTISFMLLFLYHFVCKGA